MTRESKRTLQAKRTQCICLVVAALILWEHAGGRIYAVTREAQIRQAKGTNAAAPFKGIDESRFDQLLSELKEVIRQGEAKTKAAPEKGFAGIEKLSELKAKLSEENEKNQEYFSGLESLIKEKRLPAEILERHTSFVREYEARYETLMDRLDGIESAHRTATGFLGKLTGANKSIDWEVTLGSTLAFLEERTPQPKPRQSFDPHNLPHRSLKTDHPIPPKLTREEWNRSLSDLADSTEVENADSIKSKGASSSVRAASAASTASSSGSRAAVPARSFSSTTPVTAPPTSADLAETIEVQFTPEIRQLADSLDRNPVKIYNWVRNNIEFVPTWGSIQGAQLCMETHVGNAFDTASLLIALLRVSGIPARYQMGTIEVPIEKFKNWAGGFTDADAAASMFASGGVPSVVRRIDQTGRIVTVRLEHVWLKAFVDYAPSGGVVNVQGDTWIEMDASFKQYSFVQGVDFETVTPSGAQAFVNQIVSTAVVDPTTGSVTSIDASNLRPFLQQRVAQRYGYVRTNLPDATVLEVLGGKKISGRSLALSAAATPYRVLVRASELSQIPDALRHKVTFNLGTNPQLPTFADLFTRTLNTAELAGKNVLLLYTLASPADEQLFQTAIVSSSNATPSWPSSINVVPQLYVGKLLVAVGRPLRAGSPIVSQIMFSSPTISTPAVLNHMSAGEAAAIGLDLQGISPSQMQTVSQNAQSLADKIERETFQGLTNRDIAEFSLSSSIVGWFGLVDLNDKLTARNAGVVTVRYPSAGLFFFRQRVHSLFGAAASVSADGLSMDIDRDVVISMAKDGASAKAARLALAQGAYGSAMEADLPARVLSTATRPVNGVGTMQALKLANDQGIPIYQVDASNAPTVLPLLRISPGDLTDIQDAINAGLEVITSKSPVNFNGQTVLGMIISDPLSGSSTFLISGGTNGAIILVTLALLLLIVLIGFQLPFLLPLGITLLPGLLLLEQAAVVIISFSTFAGVIALDNFAFPSISPFINMGECQAGFLIAEGLLGLLGLVLCGFPCLMAGTLLSVGIGEVLGPAFCA